MNKKIWLLAVSLTILLGFEGVALTDESATTAPAPISSSPAPVALLDPNEGFGPGGREAHAAGLRAFQAAKFGLFIHWGLYSVPAGVWKGKSGYGEWFQIETRMPLAEYAKFAAQFNPTKFNAREWARNLKADGVKYIIMTTKHHDGFAMYDTKLEDYNIVQQTPWKHDPMPELAAACKEAGIMLCFYYSLPDWHSRDFPARYSQGHFHGNPNPDADIEKYVLYMKGQIRELLTQYGPIGALWFDDGGAFPGLNREQRAQLIHAQEIIDEVHHLQPGCVIDDRLGLSGDYDTPEQVIPGGVPSHPFETCMPLNHHWGYNQADHDWKSPETVVRQLVTVASKGGNYLLGVGAMADGTYPPPEAQSVLLQVGHWLKTNGASVYGTTAGPVQSWWLGRVTRKDKTIYLHLFTWSHDGHLSVPIRNAVKRAYLLADPAQTPLEVTSSSGKTTITLPAQAPDPIDTVVALELADPAQPVEPVTSDENLALGKPVEVSSVWPNRPALDAVHVTDGKGDTFWGAEQSARTGWVKVDLQAEHTVTDIMLSDAPFSRTQAFTVEAQVGGKWKQIAEGTTIGDGLVFSFPAVKAQVFRVNILKAKDTPTLSEIQIFGK
jgi:alpha-L-fucosidase